MKNTVKIKYARVKEIIDTKGGVTFTFEPEEDWVDTPRVTRREFEQYTSKYLKDLPIIVTMRGVDDFVVKEIGEEDCDGE